jgi:hypothetical protein
MELPFVPMPTGATSCLCPACLRSATAAPNSPVEKKSSDPIASRSEEHAPKAGPLNT